MPNVHEDAMNWRVCVPLRTPDNRMFATFGLHRMVGMGPRVVSNNIPEPECQTDRVQLVAAFPDWKARWDNAG